MSGKAGIDELELNAFVDGELDVARLRSVQEAIDGDRDLTERVTAIQTDKLRVRQIYGPLIDRSLPAEWIRLTRHGRGQVHLRRTGPIAAIAAALIVFIAAASYAVYDVRTSSQEEVVQTALDARGAESVPVKVIGVASGGSRQYNGVLAAAVGLDVKVPDLGALGYQLVQIRLYRISGAGAAELSYRDRQNRLFTLYLRHSDGSVRFDQFARAGLRICVWQDEDLSTVMAGNVTTAAMQRLASLAYTGLTL
ncbi:MAG: hypothetical protein KGO48_19360 [Alphaproteobacteria bacterium]|nr:hypothetical protein [Alphaproteobacteria bacterium]